jgi:hypothetical protein
LFHFIFPDASQAEKCFLSAPAFLIIDFEANSIVSVAEDGQEKVIIVK